MGAVQLPEFVMPLCAITSGFDDAFDWSIDRFRQHGWTVACESRRFAFDMTDYYQSEMGAQLNKQIYAFSPLAMPQHLPDWKLMTNQWESDFKTLTGYAPDRPVNLDPGYLTLAKFVLATTKDRDHRLYLDRGIFAEVTMSFSGGQWRSHRWTYPDYQTPPATDFLMLARNTFKELLRQRRGEQSDISPV